jgi:hypothetical protein
MRQNSSKIRHRRQNRKYPHKSIKRRRRPYINTPENRTGAAASERCIERVPERRGHTAQRSAERGRVIAGQSPEHAAACYVGAGNCDEQVDEEYDEEAGCASAGVGGLEVDGGKGKFGDGGVEDVIEGGYGVEDCDVED